MGGCWKANLGWSAEGGISTASGAHISLRCEKTKAWEARDVRHIAELSESSKKGNGNHQESVRRSVGGLWYEVEGGILD